MLTYKQIDQIEQYIKELNVLKSNCELQGKALYVAVESLENKIVASKIGYVHDIFRWDDAMNYSYDYEVLYYHDEKTRTFIDIIISSLEGILNALPFYHELNEVRTDVKYGKQLSKDQAKRNFIVEMSVKYNGKIDFGKAVQEYVKKIGEFGFPFVNDDSYCQGVIKKLEFYIDELVCDKKNSKPSTHEKSLPINIIQNNQQTVSQSMSFAFEDCFKSLNDCETLSEEDLSKIKAQIGEIQDLLKEKKGKKKTIKEKIGNILKWTADKATDVMIAVLPALVTALQGL